ncbi:MAG: hypothetical protein NZ524_05230 [Thiobacillaceae bacterium]|nr:hypothetical protein [Thiobacillaceae bacterium]MCX7672766.1 hypothetical protein [Thiobacillaceae bacterium]MDW8323216.1 hypothetical protein [Burkholderiales bacterium]
MSPYIHHVPGRLRVKSPGLKRNPHAAQEAVRYLQQVEGVMHTEANPVTGSLLIHYDHNRVAAQTLLNSLRSLGHLPPGQVPPLPLQGPGWGQQLSDRIVQKLVETALERSATALIAAVF